MNKENYENMKAFKSIQGIMVIQGKHLHYYRNQNKETKLRLDDKVYNWRVDAGTHHIKRAKVDQIASVSDNGSKNKVVISKIINATGSMAIRMAKKLKYVINIQDRHYSNHEIIKDNVQQTRSKPKRHLTITQQKRTNAQQKAKELSKSMPKAQVARKMGVSTSTIYNWLRK